MAFPTLDTAVSFERVLQGGQVEAKNIKQYLEKNIAVMNTNNLSANNLLQTAQMIKAFSDVMKRIAEFPGIDDYAEGVIGRKVTSDAQAIVDAYSDVISAVKEVISHGSDGYAALQKIEDNGDVSTRAYTPQEMAPLRTALKKFLLLIE